MLCFDWVKKSIENLWPLVEKVQNKMIQLSRSVLLLTFFFIFRSITAEYVAASSVTTVQITGFKLHIAGILI